MRTEETLVVASVDGLEHSRVIDDDDLPSLGGTGATVVSRALGYDTEDDLLLSGATFVQVSVKNGRWVITPMANDGPGQGWSSRDEVPVTWPTGGSPRSVRESRTTSSGRPSSPG